MARVAGVIVAWRKFEHYWLLGAAPIVGLWLAVGIFLCVRTHFDARVLAYAAIGTPILAYWLWRVIDLSMKRTLLAASVSFTLGLIFLAAQ